MKKGFFIGLFVGMVLGGVAYAATMKILLIDGSGDYFGTSTNPIYIQNI